MHTDIINEHLNREVEVTTTAGKMFSGNLKLNDSVRNVIVLEPQDRYDSKRFGNTYVCRDEIVTIRERLPEIEDEDTMDKYLSSDAYDSDDYKDSSESKALKHAKRALEDLKMIKKLQDARVPAAQAPDPNDKTSYFAGISTKE